ncbi:hypothetical protein [Apibacter sp.]|uniref:hypothetical protein n=1 Tax=Apibacter sp. TaxID=2023709 RepID=UPI0025CFBCFC|nr:hypothetical protein [Apibacter sp.]MCT6868578.1 hypothetical protein [Apibacter sp.]
MERQDSTSRQEINILDLLNYFKNGIIKIFTCIGNFFTNIFNALINFFILLKRFFVLIVAFVIISGAIGYYNDEISPALYNYEMIIEPNFKSTKTIYQQINSYEKLSGSKENEFYKDLKSISIFPIKSFTNEIEIYYKILDDNEDNNRDTILSSQFKISNFIKKLVDTDYPTHTISIKSKRKLSSEEIKSEILQPIENDPYCSRMKESYLRSLDIRSKIYTYELKIIDSLLLSRTKSPISATSTSLFLNGNTKNNVEMDLLTAAMNRTRYLSEIEIEKVKKSQVISVLSQPQLVDENKFLFVKKNTYAYAFYGFLLSLSIIFLIGFVKYLNDFKKKHS